MTDEEFTKVVKDIRDDGYDIDRPIKYAHGWTTGTRVRVIEDDEDQGVYRDDEGIVVCKEVATEEGLVDQIVTLAISSFSVTIPVYPTNIELVS